MKVGNTSQLFKQLNEAFGFDPFKPSMPNFQDLLKEFEKKSKEDAYKASYSKTSPVLAKLNTIEGCSLINYEGKIYFVGNLITLENGSIVAVELLGIKERILQEGGSNLGSSSLYISYDQALKGRIDLTIS